MADPNSFTKPNQSYRRSTDVSLRPALKKRSTPGGNSLLGPVRHIARGIVEQSKPDMATSFLQYCAMCERQITTPCNSILYCSEACRRKDGRKPLSAASIMSTSPPPSIPSSPSRPILAPRTPTGTYPDLATTTRIPQELHDHKSDLDPTEWKPKLPHRMHSDAFVFLSQFHRSTSSTSISINDTQSMTINETQKLDGQPASMPVPSLGNTPSTTYASSLATSAGYGYEGGYNGIGGGYGGYNFNTRPLPTRHNRWYSVEGATPRGTDLVTPHIAPNISIDGISIEEPSEDLWGKKIVVRGSSFGDDGLSRLFGASR